MTKSCNELSAEMAAIPPELNRAIANKEFSKLGEINARLSDVSKQVALVCGMKQGSQNIAQSNQELSKAVASGDPAKIAAANTQLANSVQALANLAQRAQSGGDLQTTAQKLLAPDNTKKYVIAGVLVLGLAGLVYFLNKKR